LLNCFMQNTPLEVTVYEPNYRHKYGFFKIWYIMLRNIVRSRELIYQLFRRDFLNQYKKSFLGRSWLLISPLIGAVSWVILNATGVLRPGDVGVPFPAFVLVSSAVWGLFMDFYQAGSTTLSAGTGFIMQVKFPHEALLIKQTAQFLANFIIGFILNIAILLILGVVPSWQIVFFPIAVLPIFFLGAGLGLVISLVSVVATDISKIVTTMLTFLFYITPVVFSPDTRSETLQKIVDLNPMTYLIDVPRDLILYGKVNNLETFLWVALFSFIFFMLSWRLFFVSEDKVVERMI
jgi:lipopolysaccharide transport system permease protein